MFAVRLRASIKPFLRGSYSEISAISKRILQDRYSDRKQILNSLRLSGNEARIKLFIRGFHSSPQCYISESNAEMNMIMKILTEKPELEKSEVSQKTKSMKKKKNKKKDEQVSDSVSIPNLLTEKQEIEKSELSQKTKSMMKEKKDEQVSDLVSKPKLLTEKPELEKSVLFQQTKSMKKKKDDSISKPTLLTDKPELEKSELSQKTKSMKKKKKDEQVSDSISKPKLLTEKPEVPWNLNGKRKKTEAHASSPSRDATDPNVLLSLSRILSGVNEDTVVPEVEETCKDQMGMRIKSCSEELEKHLEMQSISGKDLEVLLHSVMHLENHPIGGSR